MPTCPNVTHSQDTRHYNYGSSGGRKMAPPADKAGSLSRKMAPPAGKAGRI